MPDFKFEEFDLSLDELLEADKVVSMIEFCTLHTEDNKQFWAYVAIPPSKYLEYRKKHEQGGSLNLFEYGEVIKTGWGANPSDETVQEMKEKYGTNKAFEKKFIQSLTSRIDTLRKVGEK